jgi:hypothetical protein
LFRQRIISPRRSFTIGIVAAGALTTTAVVAATWTAGPSGSRAALVPQAHAAAAAPLLAATGQLASSPSVSRPAGRPGQQASPLRDTTAQLAATRWTAAEARATLAVRAASPATAGSTASATSSAKATATAQPTTKASASAAATSKAKAASASPQQIAKAMLASFGWSSGQFSCLQPLWAHESGWSVTAHNAGTGAYGIPQAAPGSKMASAGPDWQTSATTQIKWGLKYIKGTYGSLCGAWSHEQATGWY